MSEQTAIVPFASYDETERVAKAMVASGFFKDVQQTSQAIVKILAGRELGFGPFASLTGVNVIQNKPVIGANLLASAIKATRKYNYRILEMTDKACEIEFFEDGKAVGKSRFTMEDAQKAGLENKDNWRKYPRNMLFARAISNGQKWYCPDACNGVTVYTPDEMGATVDEDGQVVNLPPVKVIDQPSGNGHNPTPPEPEPIPTDQDTAVLPIEQAPSRPYDVATLKQGFANKAKKYLNKPASEKQRGLVAGCLSEIFAGPDSELQRHALQQHLFGVSSLNDVSDAMIHVLLDWLKPVKDTGGAYVCDPMAVKEAQLAYTDAVKAQGQQTLL